MRFSRFVFAFITSLSLIIGAASATVTHVANDAQSDTISNVTSLSVTATHTPSPGDELITWVSHDVSEAVTSSGWTCTQLGDKLNYCLKPASGTANSWTFSWASSSPACVVFSEFSGANTTTPNSGSGSNAAQTATVTVTLPTPTPAPALAVGFIGSNNHAGSFSIPTGWSAASVFANNGTGLNYCWPGIIAWSNSQTSTNSSATGGFTSYASGSYTQFAAILMAQAAPSSSSGESFMGIWERDRFERLLNNEY